MSRQIVLDTETTGLSPSDGHKIIEIGCVELVNRRLTRKQYHQYLNPDREIDAGAVEVHGITLESLQDKPRFADVMENFLDFLGDSELIIHNAPFDVGFLQHELKLAGAKIQNLQARHTITDTLLMARKLHPGQKNNLDALCRRYEVDNTQRTLHGALLDAEILADVYLMMTGGQASLLPSEDGTDQANGLSLQPGQIQDVTKLDLSQSTERPRVIQANAEELAAHQEWLAKLAQNGDGVCVWKD